MGAVSGRHISDLLCIDGSGPDVTDTWSSCSVAVTEDTDGAFMTRGSFGSWPWWLESPAARAQHLLRAGLPLRTSCESEQKATRHSRLAFLANLPGRDCPCPPRPSPRESTSGSLRHQCRAFMRQAPQRSPLHMAALGPCLQHVDFQKHFFWGAGMEPRALAHQASTAPLSYGPAPDTIRPQRPAPARGLSQELGRDHGRLGSRRAGKPAADGEQGHVKDAGEARGGATPTHLWAPLQLITPSPGAAAAGRQAGRVLRVRRRPCAAP